MVQYGLIAEEVNKIYPELVIHDAEGKIDGVRYDELAPILLQQAQTQQQNIMEQQQKLSAQETQLTAQAQELNELRQQMAEVKQQNQAMQAVLMKLQQPEEKLALR